MTVHEASQVLSGLGQSYGAETGRNKGARGSGVDPLWVSCYIAISYPSFNERLKKKKERKKKGLKIHHNLAS